MFIPATQKEVSALGWEKLDVILITGDAYIDSPFIGVSVIGKVLLDAGYKVGIISQPDLESDKDISRFGEPALFWGVTSGCVDSMVANYTAVKKRRKSDDFTPGGMNTKRPDRAVIAYTNLIKKYFKNTKSIVLGGIEASLRRIPHYDYWDNMVRRSILFDAKADYLIYGMGEKCALELANALKNRTDVSRIRGLAYISKEIPRSDDILIVPSFEEVKIDKHRFTEMFRKFYNNNDPFKAKVLCQKQDMRYLIVNQPQASLTEEEIDAIYGLEYVRDAHPSEKAAGKIKALETIRFSITSHRGCYGECNFCSITVHQGMTIQSRSERSILKEAKLLSQHPDFKGYILDVGGPTANMYGSGCKKMDKKGVCSDKDCLYPDQCSTLSVDHRRQINLLTKIADIPGVKKVFVASGIRHDMVMQDNEFGQAYLNAVTKDHTSGQMKIAPEHFDSSVLGLMRKTGAEVVYEFKEKFFEISRKFNKKQYITYYMIAAHPGCSMDEMKRLRETAISKLKILPEQIQIFTPTPSTYSTLMYYTETDPFTGKKIFVEKDNVKKEKQKSVITGDAYTGKSGYRCRKK